METRKGKSQSGNEIWGLVKSCKKEYCKILTLTIYYPLMVVYAVEFQFIIIMESKNSLLLYIKFYTWNYNFVHNWRYTENTYSDMTILK